MIKGRNDTFLTVEEFAEMIGREPKTVKNWASRGKIRLVSLCGVPLISLNMIENLIEGRPTSSGSDELAKRLL